MKGYEDEDPEQCVINYATDFKKWVKELKECDIDYTKYFCHFSATKRTFRRFCGQEIRSTIDSMPAITFQEDGFFDNCYLGGAMYLAPEYKNQAVQTYGYDFSANYPSLMASEDFKVPTVAPTYETITKVPKKFILGIYRVIVSCDDPDFRKVFTFSKKHHYTSYSLNWALELQERFNVVLTPIIDNQPNAMKYKRFINGQRMFGSWYNKLMFVKKKYPKNKLVKHLLSSLWGTLSKKNTQFKSCTEFAADKEFQKTHLIKEHHFKANGSEYYEIVPINNLYDCNIRLKPFITSCAQVNIGRVILDNIDSFVRCHTDNACFTQPIDHTQYERLIPEDKTSGMITWKNVNSYHKE